MNSLSIPIKLEDAEHYLGKEIEVDFSKIEFGNISKEKQLNTAFLYFRNTGFDFKPDFSNCTNEQIANILKVYLTTEYDVPNKYFQLLWLKLVLHKVDVDVNDGILSYSQTAYISEMLSSLVDELMTFILSLPIYAVLLLAKDEKYADSKNFDESCYSEFGINLYNILQDEQLEEVLQILQIESPETKTKFYRNYFKKDNLGLVEAVKNIHQFGLLYEIFKATNIEANKN